MNKYVIAVVGFTSVAEGIAALEEMMEKERIWLFTIAGSGSGISKEIAEKIGSPYIYCKSLKEVEYKCNYIVADIRAGQEIKNWVMQMKARDKHGMVYRKME